jgi:hypothetical protein
MDKVYQRVVCEMSRAVDALQALGFIALIGVAGATDSWVSEIIKLMSA